MPTEYITAVTLEPYFVDKDTGAPLSGGYVQFWKDSDRVVPKLVFQKVATGALDAAGNPVYEFVALPDPVQLSAVGTFQNAGGDNIAVYYYPYDADGNVELYYVAVYNSLGVQQFTREGWPGSGVGSGSGGSGAGAENMLSNSQFVDINFSVADGVTYTSAGAETVVIPIAAKWNLSITFTGVGTVVVTRDPIAGNANIVTNPPFALSVVGGNNISEIVLIQRLNNNPGIWAALDAGVDGYIASHMILGPGSSATMSYAPSVGAPTQLLTGNNVGAEYTAYTATVQLAPSANTDDGDDGYVDIKISLDANGTTDISSIQIVPLNADIDGIEYIQEPVNRQIDHLFNYFNALLQYKPIPSYLVGWDFPLNPTQFLGPTVGPFATGANTSNYFWDQTIIFQTLTNSVRVSRNATDKSLNVFGVNASSVALIQYLQLNQVRDMLQNPMSVNICGDSGGIGGCISLWVSTDASLPDMGANQSLVATLDANGKPATFNGNWTEIPRSNLGDALYTVEPSTGQKDSDTGFFGWDLNGAAVTITANWFAIVVGIVGLGNSSVDFLNISCVPGNIPTRPAPQSAGEVYLDCCQYYAKSFAPNTVPASGFGTYNIGEPAFLLNVPFGGPNACTSDTIYLPTLMWTVPDITLYNPQNANSQVYNTRSGADCSSTSAYNISQKSFAVDFDADAMGTLGDHCVVAWVADARLGIV